MQKKSVFLLQDGKEIIEELSEKFKSKEDYEVVGRSTDGISAITMVEKLKPDFLITELILTGYDGLSVISKIKDLGLNTKVIVLSALISEEIVSRAINFGADYFMAKPYNFSVLIDRMNSLMQVVSAPTKDAFDSIHKITLDEKISKIFINVGIPPHIKGYSFLREGVKMAVADP